MIPGIATDTTNPTIASHSHLRNTPRKVAKPRKQPLGNIVKLASKIAKRGENIRKRYQLQSTARRLLPDWKGLGGCHRKMSYGCDHIGIEINSERSRLTGVQTCKSAVCPVCSAKLAHKHMVEVAQAMDNAFKSGFLPVFVTYTLSHNRETPLSEIKAVFSAARRKHTSGGTYDRLCAHNGIIGEITTYETTWSSANGWHPHAHGLLFIDARHVVDLAALEDTLKTHWQNAVKASGGFADYEHGFVLKVGHEAVSEYIAKFGHMPENTKSSVELELTHGHAKLARKHGKTPFQLLDAARSGAVLAGKLFVEYAETQRGKAVIRWSKGLRGLLGLDDETDEETTPEREQDVFKEICHLSPRALRFLNDDGGIGDVLVAAVAGIEALTTMLDSYGVVLDARFTHPVFCCSKEIDEYVSSTRSK